MSDVTLTNYQLNRALLARQFLLRRVKIPVGQMLEQLVGMQAQNPPSPYYALFSRIEGFTTEQLARLIAHRSAVRLALMRSTIHLVTARDALELRPIMQATITRQTLGGYGKRLKGLDLAALEREARALVRERAMLLTEFGAILAESRREHDADALGNAIRALVPMVQPPPRGVWGAASRAVHICAETFLGKPFAESTLPDRTIVRYLAAFGPATVMDAQAWSGLTKLGPAFDRLRPKLLTFRNEDGDELFDVRRGPRPVAPIPAPPRFLPDFDNVLLAHADRTRIIDDDVRQRVWGHNMLVPTALVNGRVAALWRVDKTPKAAKMTIQPLTNIARKDRKELADEGKRLLAFAHPERRYSIGFSFETISSR